MRNISITIRGFDVSTQELLGLLGGNCSLSGDRGSGYRGRPTSVLKKSFVFNEIKIGLEESVSLSIMQLLSNWGGADHISNLRDRYSFEDIYFEIYSSLKLEHDAEDRIIMSAEVMAGIARIGAQLNCVCLELR
jgi:hypothetical protein